VLIALLNTKHTPRARYILECFRLGAARHGDTCFWVEDAVGYPLLDKVDVGVQVCLPNKNHDSDPVDIFRLEAWERMKVAGKRSLVIDTGFLNNQYDFAVGQKRKKRLPVFDVGNPATYPNVDAHIYYELAYDGIKGFGDHCCAGAMPAERWQSLGCTMKPRRLGGSCVLLLTQPLHGQSSQGVNIFGWYDKTLVTLRRLTPLPFVARMHPRVDRLHSDARGARRYRRALDRRLPANCRPSWATNLSLTADLAQARLAVAYSTNAAVMAVIEGVPVYVGSKSGIAWPMSESDLAKVLAVRRPVPAKAKTKTARARPAPGPPAKTPDDLRREAWLHSLAYYQWNLLEMKTGACWAHYRPYALSPRGDVQ